MSTNFIWDVIRMERRASDNYVTRVDWMLTGTNDGVSETLNGSASFDPVENFIPYNDLTKEQVLEWIQSKLDVDAHYAVIEGKITEKKNPTVIVGSPPWQPEK
jgi:hypothetical protein